MYMNFAQLLAKVLIIFFISNFFTVAAHIITISHMSALTGSFLDVGCGTGVPLQKILSTLKNSYDKIVGIDLHTGYTEKAQKLFDKEDKVCIYHMNFYDIGTELKQKFNFIFFSFSFMLMPDPIKAIQMAKFSL